MVELKIQFSNKEAASAFKTWLSESGENNYWDWMEIHHEGDDTPDLVADWFDYSNDLTIPTKCSSL